MRNSTSIRNTYKRKRTSRSLSENKHGRFKFQPLSIRVLTNSEHYQRHFAEPMDSRSSFAATFCSQLRRKSPTWYDRCFLPTDCPPSHGCSRSSVTFDHKIHDLTAPRNASTLRNELIKNHGREEKSSDRDGTRTTVVHELTRVASVPLAGDVSVWLQTAPDYSPRDWSTADHLARMYVCMYVRVYTSYTWLNCTIVRVRFCGQEQ